MDRQYFKQNVSPVHQYDNTVEHTLSIIGNTIGATYGPYGTHNIFKNGPDVNASKDGYENLTMMKFDGSIASMVYQMAFEVAGYQASKVGDGTTTAILIMEAVYKQLMGSDILRNNYTPSQIAQAVNDIQSFLISALKNNSIPLETEEQVRALVYTSVDANKELTDLLVDLYNKVPNLDDKNILLDFSSVDNSYFETVQGVNISGKIMNPAFANNDLDICTLKDVEVIIVDGKAVIENNILNYANKLKTTGKSLLVICSGVNENFYRYIELISQNQPELLRNFCVAYSSANTIQDKEAFYDILAVTNCAYLPEDTIISDKSVEELSKGFAQNVSIKDKKITLGGFNRSTKFEDYLEKLQLKLDDLNAENESPNVPSEERAVIKAEINKLRARIQRLTDGVTTIYAGGDSIQRKSINYRLVEDGLKALQSAIRHGFSVGCNTMPMNILSDVILQQKLEPTGSVLYLELAKCILNAYVNVYKKIILNMKAVSNNDIFNIILTEGGQKLYNPETESLDFDNVDFSIEDFPIFTPINLRPESEVEQVINPIQTDITIVERAIDAALVLATANTVFVEDTEFDARV